MKRALIAIPCCGEKAQTTDVLQRNEVVEFVLDLDKVRLGKFIYTAQFIQWKSKVLYN